MKSPQDFKATHEKLYPTIAGLLATLRENGKAYEIANYDQAFLIRMVYYLTTYTEIAFVELMMQEWFKKLYDYGRVDYFEFNSPAKDFLFVTGFCFNGMNVFEEHDPYPLTLEFTSSDNYIFPNSANPKVHEVILLVRNEMNQVVRLICIDSAKHMGKFKQLKFQKEFGQAARAISDLLRVKLLIDKARFSPSR